ncbi:virulence factor SrfB [Siccirubricoccus sp. KC 17139]|uniref:Virulence factor SrfB n=1 Tax=Siccirubricoccus soli TaxID=2899147 RepID=A0ABT1D6E9_9PROT|nr:virulence factor SrfB [Siccirubricoccus soli]MCO6417502.1 virulence factor SrfB [Siccirubricoccus soli]MCP2683637.1 virulence factor SrfB [Siccirubricoccus soli]
MTKLITLMPNSGIHFWDVDFDLDALPRLSRRFWEEKLSDVPDETGEVPVALRELVANEEGEFVDPVSLHQPVEEECYSVNVARALEPFLAKWVPLPVFAVLQPRANAPDLMDRGPSNWVRARIAELPPDPRRSATRPARLTLAFDTGLMEPDPDHPDTIVAPNSRTVMRGQELALVADTERNAWFINEEWVTAWLAEMFREFKQAQTRGRPLRKEDFPFACEHQARYIAFLALLGELGCVPRIRFVDTISPGLEINPVQVDLVLDVGNSRTCGILVEEHPGQGMNLSDSMPLILRDLSEPHRFYALPFESRVEFCRASLGRDAIARRAGRPGSFAWPSPVRVGPEAVRLAGARLGNEGATGISSPKRYLWDKAKVAQPWRYNSRTAGEAIDPPVSGMFMRLLTEEGEVRGLGRGKPPRGTPATRAHFSRSSLFSLMIAEIVLQALAQANSPGGRQERRDSDVPRRLRRIVLTMPPGMPLAEQRILRARAEAGVRLAWQMLGWTAPDGTPLNKLMEEPKVPETLDEATATQIVWLHNEIAVRMGGDAQALFDVLNIPAGQPLRVASIDIGGGTTDLMVASYRLGEGDAVLPAQEFRESFKTAGDDLLRQVLAEVVVPCLAAALKMAGVVDAGALLRRTLGGDQGGQSEQERHLKRQFVSQVLEPVGIEILKAREKAQGRSTGVLLQAKLSEILRERSIGVERAIAYVERQAREAGASAESVLEAEMVATVPMVDRLVHATFGPILANLCEAVWHLGCDVLLLSGRPSRLTAVADIVTARIPVPPHRIIRMHRYQVSDAYPFRDAANRIEDPKTTAAVGAMLGLQAEARLRNFHLSSRAFRMKSTARYIGRLDQSGQLRSNAVLLRDVDLDQAKGGGDVAFTTPLAAASMIGFRQLPIERWTAQPLYAFELREPEKAARLALPLRVTVRRLDEQFGGEEGDQEGLVREMFKVEEVIQANGDPASPNDVDLRLQTMERGEGYWRDTGNLELRSVP